jgi:hypothetical protein
MTLTLVFAADGPRDEAVLPLLVCKILGTEIKSSFEPWKGVRLQRGAKGLGGYGQKLLFLVRDARDRGAAGVVATVDADRDKKRNKLKDLIAARERDRVMGNTTPAALGEAIPHLEAWLLDDDVAVRTALKLAADVRIEVPTKVKSPKDELNFLCGSCGLDKTILEFLAEIAAGLSVDRCSRANQTGFHEFSEDVEAELGPISGRGAEIAL